MYEVEKDDEKAEIGLQELGRVTEETKGGIMGGVADGGHAPFNRDIFF